MKREELQNKFSKRTWNKIRRFIPEEFLTYQIFKCWQDFRGAEKKIDIESLETSYKLKYGANARIKLLYTHCEGSAQRFIKRKNYYLMIVY